MPSFDDLLACPRCGGLLRALRCEACPAQYDAPGGIPDLRLPADARTEQVRGFYLAAPFPGYAPEETYCGLQARASRSPFARSLDAAIPAHGTVLEMGCGTGQLSLFLASADRVVVGADLRRASLGLARGLGSRSIPARRGAPAHHRRGARQVPGRGAHLGARVSEHAARRRSERDVRAGGRLGSRAGSGASRVDADPGT